MERMKLLVTVAEAARILGVSRRVAYELVARQVVPPAAVLRVGRRIFLRRLVLERWISGQESEAR